MGAVRSGCGETLPSGRENAKKFAKNRAKRNRTKSKKRNRAASARFSRPGAALCGVWEGTLRGIGGKDFKKASAPKNSCFCREGESAGFPARAKRNGRRRRVSAARAFGGESPGAGASGPVSGGCAKKRWKAGERGAEITGKRRIWKIDL